MKVKIISKLAIAQLACLPLISISCGKHEQRAKENLVAVTNSPKFDKLIDKNKEDKTDKVAPIVEKIEVVNNGGSGSKQIEKSKKVEVKNQNNSNLPINVEVKNDIKIDNKINKKESKLKTFFAVIGGLTTVAAVGYGLWWLFKENEYYTIQEETQTTTATAYYDTEYNIEVTIKYNRTNENNLETKIKTFNSYVITNIIQQWTNNSNNGRLEGKIKIKGTKWHIHEIISKFKTEIINFQTGSITNFQKLLSKFKSWINSFNSKNAKENKK